jgi:hypothetical protein
MDAGDVAANKSHRPRQAGAKVNKRKGALLKKDPSRRTQKSAKVSARPLPHS